MKSSINEKKAIYEESVATVSSLEKSIHDHAGNRESRLKDLEKKIKTIKSQMQAASKNLKVSLLYCPTFRKATILFKTLNYINSVHNIGNQLCGRYLGMIAENSWLLNYKSGNNNKFLLSLSAIKLLQFRSTSN